jgi:NADH-quinone oxidoreductase subunit J
MSIASLFFYLFAVITIASGIMVISVRNPVHAVLFLILAFFNAAGLFMLLGAEFIAMILIIVYVGAVMVLFLFVVMMLDVDFAELRAGFAKYLPIGGLIGGILLAQLVLVMSAWTFAAPGALKIVEQIPPADAVTNAEAIGRVLYTKYIYFFQLAGLVLLVAMIGAIVLTLRHREGIKRQNIAAQVARDPATAIEIKKVETGQGIG